MNDPKNMLELAEKLILSKTNKSCSDLQRSILISTLGEERITYDQIADRYGYSPTYIKQDVAPKLWHLLSEVLEQKVTKSNVISVLDLYIRQNQDLLTSKVDRKEIASNKRDRELPEGILEIGSLYYIDRNPIESQCCQKILKSGALIRIKAPRYMGKSSLMERIIDRARQENYQIVSLDLDLTKEQVLEDLDLFLKWFCARMERELKLDRKLKEYWDDEFFDSKTNCSDYFKDFLLCQFSEPLVLAIDNVDRLLKNTEVSSEFFGLLRNWHEQAKKGQDNGVWKKLHLLLSYSTEAYIIPDINQSPFNVGFGVELDEFSASQVLELARRQGVSWNSNEVERLMNAIGGHPCLVQLAIHAIATSKIILSELLNKAATEEGLYSTHLRRHLINLEQQPELIAALLEVLNSPVPVQLDSAARFKLQSMGLVNFKGNKVTIRCQLYRQYFQEVLGSSSASSSAIQSELKTAL